MPAKTYQIQTNLIPTYLKATRLHLFKRRGIFSALAIIGLTILYFAGPLPLEAWFVGAAFILLAFSAILLTGSAARLKTLQFILDENSLTEIRRNKIHRKLDLEQIDHIRPTHLGLRIYKKGDRNADGDSEHKKKVYIFIPGIIENFDELSAILKPYFIW